MDVYVYKVKRFKYNICYKLNLNVGFVNGYSKAFRLEELQLVT